MEDTFANGAEFPAVRNEARRPTLKLFRWLSHAGQADPANQELIKPFVLFY